MKGTKKLSATAKLRQQLAKFLDEDEDDGGSDEDDNQMQTIIEEQVEGAEGQFRRGDVIYDLNDAADEDEVEEPPKKKAKSSKKKPIDKDMEVHMKIKSTLEALEKTGSSSKKHKDEPLDDEEDEEYESDMDEEDEEEEDYDGSEGSDDDDVALKWKDNLAQKASEAFYQRQSGKGNLRKMIYGPQATEERNSDDDEDDEDKLGGLFRIASDKQRHEQSTQSAKDGLDSSFFRVEKMQDWTKEEVLDSIRDCFVTGKWKEDEDAEDLLAMDDLDMDSEGDFEDLETGVVSKSSAKSDDKEEKKDNAGEVSPEEERRRLIEKKMQLKKQFNAEYDEGGDEKKKSYYDELKEEMDQQAQLNKSEFDGLDDEVRVQFEGFRPGMYVRMEIENVPCELLTNFDATYPLIVGALLAGEENIGFVQVCKNL